MRYKGHECPKRELACFTIKLFILQDKVLISSRIDLSAVRSGNANYGRVLAETQWFVQDFQFT